MINEESMSECLRKVLGQAHDALLMVKNWDVESTLMAIKLRNGQFFTLPQDVRRKIQDALDAAKQFGFHED